MTTAELPPGAPIPVPGVAPRADDLPLEFKSYTYQSGAVYEGQFLGTKRHGRGYWRHPEGEMYEGEYAEGKQNGLGMYVFGSTGKKYLGQWAAGEMSGEGVYFFNPQETIFYCGGYTQDKKNGNGFYMYDTNMLTIQQWHAGEITQEREATPAERVDCAAKIRDIKLRVRRVAPHILGPLPEPNTSRVFKFPSGAVYTGQYVDHKKQGLGRWTHPEGDMYEGSFDDNRHSGWGVYVTGRSGKKYVGQWTGGLMHGWGIYFFTQDEAEFYVGTYIEDRKEGFGMYHYAETGRSKLQFWSKGELTRESDLDAAGIEMWHDAMRRIIAYVAPYAPSYKSKCPILASR